MSTSDRFVPSDYSKSHKQENQSFVLLQNLTKANDGVVWRLEGGLRQDTDGFVELGQDNKVAGKLEVQVRPVDSQRKNTPCYSVEDTLVGHSLRAGLPFILICYDLEKGAAFWKLITPEVFEGKLDQKTVSVYFDPKVDGIGDGFPYFERWLEINALHQEAVNEYGALWERLSNDIALKDLPIAVVDAYQRNIDTINNGFDGEFSSIKKILHPGYWKFGICVYEAGPTFSYHRVYRIPKGRNGLLLMKGKPEEVSDWFESLKKAQKAPLGFYSKIFEVRALHDMKASNFLDRPEENGRQFLYKAFSEVVEMENLPLCGELLCRENLFAFADLFGPAIGLDTLQQKLDVIDMQQRVERFSDWILQVILSSSVGGLIQLSNTSIIDFAKFGLSTGFKLAPRAIDESLRAKLRQGINSTSYMSLALSSCRTLLNLGSQVIERVFVPNGQAPLALSEKPNMEILRQNLQTVLLNVIGEYRSFVSGNGFHKLQSPVFLNDDVALYYAVDMKAWAASLENTGVAIGGLVIALHDQIRRRLFVIRNEKRELPKVTIDFSDALPPAELNVTINGKQYQAISASDGAIQKIYSDHPLREQVYEMLKVDAKRSYDANPAALEALL